MTSHTHTEALEKMIFSLKANGVDPGQSSFVNSAETNLRNLQLSVCKLLVLHGFFQVLWKEYIFTIQFPFYNLKKEEQHLNPLKINVGIYK